MKRLERKEWWARCTVYVLALYILGQIAWWGSHIISLTAENGALKSDPNSASKVHGMVWGEGSVFVMLIAMGFFYIHRTLRREFKLARIQSAFLLSVTHELKTPVAAIKLGVDTMRNRKLTEDQLHDLLQRMAKETVRLQSLSENIVLATKLEVKNQEHLREMVDLGALIRKTNKTVLTADTHIEVNLEEDCLVYGDEALLGALYLNLLENAIKYNAVDGLVCVGLCTKDSKVILTIQDQGSGIPVQEYDNVKKKFYRMGNETTRRHQGTGLGLFIVDQIVRLHETVWTIGDAIEGGCVMTLTFKPLKK